MFRLRGTPFLLTLAGLALSLSGCHPSVYREMYSPRGNHFVPPVEKAPVLPPERKTAPTAPAPMAVPDAGGAGGLPPAGPAIPGLEPAAPAAPALPMAQ